MLVILAYVILSWFITRALQRRMVASRNPAVRFGVPVVATALAVTTFWLWSNPGGLFASLAGATSSRLSMGSGAVWEFGRYPDYETLERFKREELHGSYHSRTSRRPGGATRHRERASNGAPGRHQAHRSADAAVGEQQSGVTRSHPVNRSNRHRGRYYVHCGLGRDRVNLVKHMLEGLGARTVGTEGYLEGNFFDTRIPNFERGQLGTFGGDKWLVPYPDAHEMLGNVLQGKTAHMILALDTTDVQQRKWADEARTTFKEYGIPFDDVATRPGDSGRIGQIVARMLALKGAAAVIVPLTPWEGGKPRPGSETSDQIVREFTARTHRPVVWTTHGHWVPGQPVERGHTDMPPRVGDRASPQSRSKNRRRVDFSASRSTFR